MLVQVGLFLMLVLSGAFLGVRALTYFFDGFGSLKIYSGVDTIAFNIGLFIFSLSGLFCLARRYRLGWLIAVVFLLVLLFSNLHDMYRTFFAGEGVSLDSVKAANEAERQATYFVQRYKALVMAALQAVLLARLVFVRRIRKEFGIRLFRSDKG